MFWKPTTESTRYYYSEDKLFEKSLDVYKPINGQQTPGLPIVVLVVGSGWTGHRAFVYAQTSWWNSSGPKTIASLGTTCVCIRHRGAFCVLPKAEVVVQNLALLFALVVAITGGLWDAALAVTAPVALVLALFAIGGRGAASLDDMLEDVAEALKWVDCHRDLLELSNSNANSTTPVALQQGSAESLHSVKTNNTPATAALSESFGSDSSSDSESDDVVDEDDNNNNNHLGGDSTATPPMVFGGYSSGGHVATTLLHEPERFERHGLSTPNKLFQGILVLSGMMAVRPERITVQDCKTQQPITLSTPTGAPTFLTNFVVNTVWGEEAAKRITSPLAQTRPPPSLPHLLVGCRNEMFGLNWLDVFFCSQEYCDKVKGVTGQPAKYVQVESDHWNVLNSKALRNALQDELPQLVR